MLLENCGEVLQALLREGPAPALTRLISAVKYNSGASGGEELEQDGIQKLLLVIMLPFNIYNHCPAHGKFSTIY